MQDKKRAVFLTHYNVMHRWVLKNTGLPSEEALCLVHSFFIHWNKANVKDIGKPLDNLLWISFINSVKSYFSRLPNVTFEGITEENGGIDLTPEDLVLPRISFQQFYYSLTEKQKLKINALLKYDTLKEVDQALGIRSIKTIKDRDLKPKFKEYFVGKLS